MTVSILCPMSFTTWFDPYNPGAPVAANLYYYHAGSEDLITVYTDAGLAIPHAQPVLTMGSGRVPPVWIGELPEAGYRVRVFDQYSVLLEDVDGLPGATEAAAGGGGEEPADPTRLLSTGDVIWAFSNNQPREGFVMCNGGSVGSALSAATQRAHDNTQALFTWLWQQDVAGTILTIAPGGRGASAASDWAANKHIATPDLQGRSVVGVDAMAATAKNRLAGVPFSIGDQAMLGSVGGEALHTLTLPESPNHNHSITTTGHTHTTTIPAHNHTFSSGSAASAGSHTHTGATDTEAGHSHVTSAGAGTSQGFGNVGTIVAHANTNSSIAGAHSHSLTINANGDHTHTVSGTISTQAQQVITSSSTDAVVSSVAVGGGGAHNNTPLSMTLCAYMRL